MIEICVVCNAEKVLITFIVYIKDVNSVILKEFLNNFIKIGKKYCNNVEINMYVLEIWIID